MGLFDSFIVNSNTKRIVKGTTKLVQMSDEDFTKTIEKYQELMEKTGDYEIPNWFTIKLRPLSNDQAEFVGTFHEGKEYDKINKSLFIELLDNNNVKYQKISDNEEIYKIMRH